MALGLLLDHNLLRGETSNLAGQCLSFLVGVILRIYSGFFLLGLSDVLQRAEE